NFVEERIRTRGSVTFDDVQRVAMKISGTVKPRILDYPTHVNNQCVPIPRTARPTHPRIDRGPPLASNIYNPGSERKFIAEGHVFGRLHDLKRERHIGRARYPRQVTFDNRI